MTSNWTRGGLIVGAFVLLFGGLALMGWPAYFEYRQLAGGKSSTPQSSVVVGGALVVVLGAAMLSFGALVDRGQGPRRRNTRTARRPRRGRRAGRT
jgi:hypothetical protein